MQIFQARPPPQLRSCIDRFWGRDCAAGGQPRLLPMFPGPGGAEIFFHHAAPLAGSARAGEGASALPRAHVVRLRSGPLHLAPRGDIGFVAVRIRAGALEQVLGHPAAVLTDAPQDLRDLWGAAADALLERLAICRNFEERAAVLGAALDQRLRRACPPAGLPIDAAIAGLLRRQFAVADVAAALGLGVRQLENRFRQACGCSPARFRRLARLRRSVKSILLAPRAAGGLDEGYFDQAQQIREFRQFTGYTPGELRRAAAGHAHFYNPSWPASAKLSGP